MVMQVLVIAPHPDDESIGCGGTICAHTARGDRVTAVFLTSGESGLKRLPLEEARCVREREAEAAAEIMKVASVSFLRGRDRHLGNAIEETATALGPILDRDQPERIYLPHDYDWHGDHRACLPIVQLSLKERQIPVPTLLGYEVLTPLSEYDYAEDISLVMDRKLAAIRAYRSQLNQFRYDRAARALAQFRGAVAGMGRHAEVFQITDERLSRIPRARRAAPDWHRVYEAAQEISRLVPQDALLILADSGQLEIPPLIAPRRCVPFLEKDGIYWGMPEDDENAIRELTRLRQTGADFMIFALSAVCWLEYYPGLRRQLQCNFRCLLENDRLVVFDLQAMKPEPRPQRDSISV